MSSDLSKQAAAFLTFEHEGWETVCEGYETHFGRLTRQSVDTLLDAAAVSPGMRVLDVCCGPGMIAAAVADRGAEATGLDFSAATVELAAARVPQARFREGDAQALPFADGSFDAVVCGFGIIHLPDPQQGLAEIYRVLKPGARAAVSVWMPPTMDTGFGILYGAIKANADMDVPLPQGPDFFQFSDPGRLDEALTTCGFGDARTVDVEQFWEFDQASDLIAAVLEGTVRARGLIEAQTGAVQQAIEKDVAAAMEAFRGAGESYRVPMPALVGSGMK